MVNKVFASKKGSAQVWTADGKRLVVTQLAVSGNTVSRTGDSKVQLGFGDKKLKNVPAAQRKQLEKAGFTVGKRVFFEAETDKELTAGQVLPVQEVLSVGDMVKITGTSKGRGFAGVIKRHGFAGGPRTHGQSDRERAPGAIGQGTTPGRVFPGKKMPGHFGVDTKTLEGVKVIAIDEGRQVVWVKGTLPGSYNGLISITRMSDGKPLSLHESSLGLLNIEPDVKEEEVVEQSQE